jgi:hypothetical protein
MAYATEAHLFITDENQSPFNVGTRLTLQDFSFEQVADINRRYGSPLQTRRDARRFYQLFGGQPYLVRRGLNYLVSQKVGIADLEAEVNKNEGLFDDHLRRLILLLAKDPELCAAIREVLQGNPCRKLQEFYRLRTAGVIVGDSPHEARLRCELYAAYLKRYLL